MWVVLAENSKKWKLKRRTKRKNSPLLSSCKEPKLHYAYSCLKTWVLFQVEKTFLSQIQHHDSSNIAVWEKIAKQVNLLGINGDFLEPPNFSPRKYKWRGNYEKSAMSEKPWLNYLYIHGGWKSSISLIFKHCKERRKPPLFSN